jgi:hypothetical protein
MPTLPTNPSNKTVSAVSFESDILPLFRPMDIQCMRGLAVNALKEPRAVFLADYGFMSAKDAAGDFAHAKKVLALLKDTDAGVPRMPLGGPYWSDESIDLFQSWINGGCKP